MMNNFLYAEVNLVCILVLVLLCVKVKSSMFLQEQRQLFVLEAIATICLLLFDVLWAFVDSNTLSTGRIWNWLLNGSYFITSGFAGYFWFLYSETVQNSKLVREKRYRLLGMLPLFVFVLCTVISFKTGWIFFIDEHNVYHRGPAYPLQLIVAYGYIAFTALKALHNSRHTDDYRRRLEMQALSAFVMPPILAGILQVVLPGYPFVCVGIMLGILYVYLTLQEQLVSLDALTKINNRNQLYQYLFAKLHHIHEDKELYLLLMDIDYFKSINDQYGHVEGDHALKLVANCLMKMCHGKNYFIARYGGDEFVVICELEPSETVKDVCDGIHNSLKELNISYNLSLSIGYAKYEPGIRTQQDFIERADKELYKIKKSRPKQRI